MTPSLVWFISGIALLVLELMVPLPTMLVAGALGIGAVIVSGLLWLIPLPPLVQFLLWAVSSGLFVLYSRRFVPTHQRQIKEDDEAVTLTEILPGQAGRVKYEGSSWKARCEDLKVSIPAHETVYVLRKQGTTLVVMPKAWLKSLSDS
ncbi:MAG: NfeD family protein [Pseudanabaenaceae cyanobacterium bins.68]|nr:NfeD family protein [Pseudanabaenaceae cyanobacterium bins.68]